MSYMSDEVQRLTWETESVHLALEKANETISRLRELMRDAYFDGRSDGQNDDGTYYTCNAYKESIKL